MIKIELYYNNKPKDIDKIVNSIGIAGASLMECNLVRAGYVDLNAEITKELRLDPKLLDKMHTDLMENFKDAPPVVKHLIDKLGREALEDLTNE